MLPAIHRLRLAADFTDVVRRGRRAGRPSLMLHLLAARPGAAASPALVGLVVGRAVGGSVVRSRTSRRLRHQLRERVRTLAPGSRLVVRAGPRAGSCSSAELGADLDVALAKLGVGPAGVS